MVTSLPIAGVLFAAFVGRMLHAGGVALDARAVIALGFCALIVLARVVDVPALGLAATVLLPYGVLLASLSVYALVRSLAGPESGVLVSVALLLVPDASTYGLQNGFFGFHWLLFTSPGSWYGLGGASNSIMERHWQWLSAS